MYSLQSIARIFYGLGIAGIGILEFLYPGFRPIMLPIPPETTQPISFLIYLTGAVLVVAGLAIALEQKVRIVSLYLALFLLLFLILGHLPNRLMNHPDMLGAWTDPLKLLALSGGALVISRLYPDMNSAGITGMLEKIAPFGKYFFAFMLMIFGIDHFLYVDFVKTLVPTWIGTELFWTYFCGVALFAAGLAIFVNFKPGIISLLLAAMLFIWLIVLHIPRAAVAPATDNGNEWISVCEDLAFCGIAVLYPYSKKRKL